MTVEPALRLEGLVNQEVLADDALRCHREAILVPYVAQDESDLERSRLAGGFGIETKGLHGIGLAGLDHRRRLDHHAAHVLQCLDEVGLAARVGAIDDGTAQEARRGLEPGGQGVGVLEGLVFGRHKTQHLLVAQAAEVLHAELDQHRLTQNM